MNYTRTTRDLLLVITYLFLEETLKVFIKQSLTQVAGCGMKSQMRLD